MLFLGTEVPGTLSCWF